MTTKTEGRHAAEFILSEANGNRSRENGTLASGQNLIAGTVLMDNGDGKLRALSAAQTVAGQLDGDVKGVLIEATDASGGDTQVAYIARDAEVNGNLITLLTETTGGAETAAATAGLLALGIIVR
jgi:hypothetical protein